MLSHNLTRTHTNQKHVDDYTSEEVLNDPRKFIDAAHYAFLVADSDSKGTLSKNEVS